MSIELDVSREAADWNRFLATWRTPSPRPAEHQPATKVDQTNQAPPAPARAPSRGEANPRARLTDDEVRAIRSRRNAGERSADLAAEFGITPRMVNLIARRERWSHVADAA
jgi:hypothetical protein